MLDAGQAGIARLGTAARRIGFSRVLSWTDDYLIAVGVFSSGTFDLEE
jgi:hypothetical protein